MWCLVSRCCSALVFAILVLLVATISPVACGGDYDNVVMNPPVEELDIPSSYRMECIPVGPTAACLDGHPVWDSLTYGDWYGMDCLLIELIEGIVVMGRNGIVEWIETCADLPWEEQGALGPQQQYFSSTTKIPGFQCHLPGTNNRSIVIQDWNEVDILPSITDPENDCRPIGITTVMEVKPCSEMDTVSLCNDEGFDYKVFDMTLRPDCVARSFRDEFIQLGLDALDYYTSGCSNHRRHLAYNSDGGCPGGMTNKYQYMTEVYQLDCQASWHWHLFGTSENGIRGISFNPLLKTIGSIPSCAASSSSCTTVEQESLCQPSRPYYFDSGPHFGNVDTKVYTCPTISTTDKNNDNNMMWHFSGNFRGTIYLPGTIVSPGSGGCVATTNNGMVRVSASTKSWCNVWIQLLPTFESILDSLVSPNICI